MTGFDWRTAVPAGDAAGVACVLMFDSESRVRQPAGLLGSILAGTGRDQPDLLLAKQAAVYIIIGPPLDPATTRSVLVEHVQSQLHFQCHIEQREAGRLLACPLERDLAAQDGKAEASKS